MVKNTTKICEILPKTDFFKISILLQKQSSLIDDFCQKVKEIQEITEQLNNLWKGGDDDGESDECQRSG